MRRRVVPAVVLAMAASRASAQLVYEPFDYGTASVGTNLGHTSSGAVDPFSGYFNPMAGAQWFDGNTGIGSGTPYEVTIQSGGVTPSYTNQLAAASGNLANFNNSSATAARSARLAITPGGLTGGTVYFSFTFRITDLGQVPQDSLGGFFAGFNNDTGTTSGNISTVATRLHVRRDANDPAKFNIGVRSNSSGAVLGTHYDYLQDPIAGGTTAKAFSVSENIFVVGSYQFGGGSSDDVSALWVNPAASSFGAASAPARGNGIGGTNMALTNQTDLASVSSFLLRQGNVAVPAGLDLDELRVDTTWAGVTAPKGTTWTGSGNWGVAGNWDTASEPGGAASFVNFSGAGGTVNLEAAKTAGTINIKSTGTYVLAGSTLTLDGGPGGQGNINVYAVMNNPGGPPTGSFSNSSHTISAPLNIASNSAMNIASGQTLTVSNVIFGSGTGLRKNGGGTLLLTNSANTFSGGLTVANGITGFVADGSLGAAGGAINLARATLRFDNAAASISAGRTITILGSSNSVNQGIFDTNGNDVAISATITGVALTKSGNGTLTLSGTNSHVGNFVTGGTLAIQDDSNLGTAPGVPTTNITLSNGGGIRMVSSSAVPAASRIFNMSTGGGIFDTNGFDATLTQRIFGAGGLGKRGAGTLTLAPGGTGNDYQGATTLSGGILQAGVSSALGNDGPGNRLVFDGGTFGAIGSFASVNRGIAVNNNGGTIDTQGNNVTFGGSLTGTGKLTKIGAGDVVIGGTIDAGSLDLSQGRIVTQARTGTPTLAASDKPVYVNGTLAISDLAALDLKDQDLVVSYGTNPNPYVDLKALRTSGWGNGLGGLTSSVATPSQILALFDNAIANKTEWPPGSGHTITAGTIIGKFTYYGDANIDGQVTGDDYTLIDSNLGTTPALGSEWLKGDTNLDGSVTGDDYTVIDSNLGLGSGNPLTPSSLSVVPEPGILGAMALGAATLLARRRRHRDYSSRD